MNQQTSPFHNWPGNTRTLFAGGSHRHFGGICRTDDGVIHLAWRKAAEHATSAEGSIAYATVAQDGGGMLSTETIIAAGGGGRDLRDCSVNTTRSGRLVLHWTECDAVPTGTGPTYFCRAYSDDNGVTWSGVLTYDTIPFDFARNYGAMKQLPNGRLYKPGYKQTASGPNRYACTVYWSDDDGDTWAEGTPIYAGSGGYNETDIAFINDRVGFACIRATGLNWAVTTDGGATWSTLSGGVYSAPVALGWDTSGFVAPSLDYINVDGVPFIVLGYCNRDDNLTEWRWARADQLMANAEAMAMHKKVTSAANMVNASGYQKPIIYPSGEMLFVEFKEFDSPNKTSDVRLVYGRLQEWLDDETGSWTPVLKGKTNAGAPIYDAQLGEFLKDGEQVTKFGRIDLASKGGIAGQIAISGLAFKVKPGPTNRAAIIVGYISGISTGSYKEIVGFAIDGTDEILLYMVGSGGLVALTDVNITDGFVLYFTLVYSTDE